MTGKATGYCIRKAAMIPIKNSIHVNKLNSLHVKFKKFWEKDIENALKKATFNDVRIRIYILSQLNEFLIGTPKEQRILIDGISKYLGAVIKYKSSGSPESIAKQHDDFKLLRTIFVDSFYKKFTDIDKEKKSNSKNDYYAYRHIKALGFLSCPYCNRNFIQATSFRKDKASSRPQIEHFYPKRLYPYLAMNFYNLVPACAACNHVKSSKDTHKPGYKPIYEFEKDDIKFKCKPTTNAKKAIRGLFDFEINSQHYQNQIDMLALDDLYLHHEDVIEDLILKKQTYTPDFIAQLNATFGTTNNENEIYRLLYCGYKSEKDWHKRPLSKLIHDILESLS